MAPISRNLLFVAISVYLVVIVVSAFKLLKLNLKHAEQTNKLESKIIETQLLLKEQELNYLKMQIHPHFLFNTLNTLYGFALKKSDELPEMVLKLSNLLDYLLYKVDKPFVFLLDDIDHLKDYIELEKIRFNNTLNIKLIIENISKDAKIAPMLLLPFVENSFKHGALKKGFLNIIISISCKDKKIYFYIENTNKESEVSSKGIGLENIKKRLDLLYKSHYELKITKDNEIFKVELILNDI
jgi:LytS/YehU family sensor histidine kinase